MKILVIGGSYFFGRWFVQYAQKENEVTVVNRGNVPIGLETVREVVADRHDADALSKLKEIDYDCIVDFCGYEEGDIKTIVDVIGKKGKRYIFVSTVDVYKKGAAPLLREDALIEDPHLEGPVGEYITGKIKLESELVEACKEAEMEYVSVRPAILYGPANYAPRETLFFDWIRGAGQIVLPEEDDGKFQLIYVEEAANMILRICGLQYAQKAYNLCPCEIDDYDVLANALREATGVDFKELRLPVKDIISRGIPLPFPLTEKESQLYAGDLARSLGVRHISLAEGLSHSYKASSR